MNIEETNLETVLSISKNIKSSTFYADLILQKKKHSIDKTKFFSDTDHTGFLSINSKSVFNIYSNDPKLSQELLNFGIQITRPSLIFADAFLNDSIVKTLSVKQYNPYTYLILESPNVYNIPNFMSYRIVKDFDNSNQTTEWHQEFKDKSDEDNNFFAPVKSDEASLFLFFNNEIFLGGIANTLRHKDHFWAGRFIVFESLRNNGHGKSILEIIESAASLSLQSIHVNVNNENEKSVTFFQKRGYLKVSNNGFWIIRA